MSVGVALLNDDDKATKEFSRVIVALFQRFDADKDGLLGENDLQAFSRECNEEGREFSSGELAAIKQIFDWRRQEGSPGGLTLQGWQQLYVTQARDAEEDVWGDMRRLGYNSKLELVGRVAAEAEVEPPRGMFWDEEKHRGELPAGGVFTLETLRRWDGEQLPMCLALCGKVVEVSDSKNFVPGQGYGKLWAGRETTYAMCTSSLKGEDADRFDFKLAELPPLQFEALVGWYKHFTTKYPVVGTLKEMDSWDFSSVEKEAENVPVPSFGK